jgi:hypothetical protein
MAFADVTAGDLGTWGGIFAGLAAVVAAVYTGVTKLRKAAADRQVRAGEEGRKDRTASLAEYDRAVKEYSKVLRLYEARIAKVEASYDRLSASEGECKEMLARAMDRMGGYEDALKAAGIAFRPFKHDGDDGSDAGGRP